MDKGTTVAGRYTVESLLGRGGMGSVWVARDEKFGERIALKVTNASGLLHEEWKARFVREARLGNRLGRSDGFVRAFDWGELPGEGLYLAMDLIPGARALDLLAGSLEERIRRLSAATRLVATAHRAGVVHRDLKPANLLQGTDSRVWLADFGLAKVAGEGEVEGSAPTGGITASGVGMGTPAFMPPEQFEDTKRVDERADVYALGVMLFAALTNGRLPYDGAASAILQKQTRVALGAEPAPRVHEFAPGADSRLVALCERAIALDRTKRLASADELLAGLEAFLKSSLELAAADSRSVEKAVPEPLVTPVAREVSTQESEPEGPDSEAPPPSAPVPERSGRLGAWIALGGIVALALAWPRLEGFVDEHFGSRLEPLELGMTPTPTPLPSVGTRTPGNSATPENPAARVTFAELDPADGATVFLKTTQLVVTGRLSDPSVHVVQFVREDSPGGPAEAGVDANGVFRIVVEIGGADGGRGSHTVLLRAGKEGARAEAKIHVAVNLDPPVVNLLPLEAWRGGPLEVRARVGARETGTAAGVARPGVARPKSARFALVADGKVVEEATDPTVGTLAGLAAGGVHAVFTGAQVPRSTQRLVARVVVADEFDRAGASEREVAIDRAPPALEVIWPPEGFESDDLVFVRVRVLPAVAGIVGAVAVDPGSHEIVKDAHPGEAGEIHALVHLPPGDGPLPIEVRAETGMSDLAKARVAVKRVKRTLDSPSPASAGANPGIIFGNGPAKIAIVAVHGAASDAGLLMGDVILALDDETVASGDEVNAILSSKRAGEKTCVTYRREGTKAQLVLVTEAPGAPPAR